MYYSYLDQYSLIEQSGLTEHHDMWLDLQKQGTWAHKIWLLFQTFMTHNVFANQLWPCNFLPLFNSIFNGLYYKSNRIQIFCSSTEKWPVMWFVPTCPVFAGLVTHTVYVCTTVISVTNLKKITRCNFINSLLPMLVCLVNFISANSLTRLPLYLNIIF